MTDKEYFNILDTEDEEWRQVILNHKIIDYDVSSHGKVRRHASQQEVKLITVVGGKNFYRFVYLKMPDGKSYTTGVHRLMGLMFIPIPKKYIKQGLHESDLVIDHIDNIKYHNVLSNLQWLTGRENIAKTAGEPKKYLDTDTIHAICEKLVNGELIYTIAEELGVSEAQVYAVRYNKRYSDITSQYEFPSKLLSESAVRSICEYLSKGYSASRVSKMLNVSLASCTGILAGARWKNISKDYVFPRKRVEKAVIVQICEMLQDGYNKRQISEALGVSVRVVERISYRETHTDISDHYDFTVSQFKVSDEVVHSICKDLLAAEEKNYTMDDIAKRNNVSRSFVKDLKYGRSRRIITSEYGLC